jgi:hypothetical protein
VEALSEWLYEQCTEVSVMGNVALLSQNSQPLYNEGVLLKTFTREQDLIQSSMITLVVTVVGQKQSSHHMGRIVVCSIVPQLLLYIMAMQGVV